MTSSAAHGNGGTAESFYHAGSTVRVTRTVHANRHVALAGESVWTKVQNPEVAGCGIGESWCTVLIQ